MNLLLAKSPRGARRLTLEQHSADTEQAAAALFRAGTRWAQSYLRFFKLGADAHDRFLLNLRVAALFHDLGKANADFQKAISARGFMRQSLRHEHLSALLVAQPAIDAWLAANPLLDRDVVLGAVLSHHLKAAEDGLWRLLDSRSAEPTKLMFDDDQVRRVLHRIAVVAVLPDPQPMRFPKQFDDPGWQGAWDALWSRAPKYRRDLRTLLDRQGLALSVKAGVIIADSVASGLFREDCPIAEWIEEVAHSAQLSEEDIEREILKPRIVELSAKLPRPFAYQRFQDGAATIGRRGLLLAACGAGKTLAAWRWAHSIARTEAIARVIFLYPTRGTATEGFRDYVGHAPEGRAALVHAAARYELLGMRANTSELPHALRDKDFVPDEAEQRLFALGLWPKRYFSATVDQFLSFMEHSYGALCLLPALADAAVVFDEIHSYDHRMWNALIAFLERFDLPVLCMTATLPPTRRAELGRLLRSYPTPEERVLLDDLEAAETRPRYRLHGVTEAQAFDAASADVRAGKRVLWVVNTVRRCQRLAERLRDVVGTDVLVYHSRYKLEDRQHRHRATVDAFRAGSSYHPKPAIAVTTQVCEMSLDLDADVLITEHAPVSSLVQRFGRAYRHPRQDPSFRAELYAYAPENPLPYERIELEAGRAFLMSLAGRDLSQRDLALGIEKHAPPGREASGASRFIDGGFFATPGNLREDDAAGAVAILDGDLEKYVDLMKHRAPTDGLRLTVPRKYARPAEPPLPSWLSLADSERYNPWLGFLVDADTSRLAIGSAP